MLFARSNHLAVDQTGKTYWILEVVIVIPKKHFFHFFGILCDTEIQTDTRFNLFWCICLNKRIAKAIGIIVGKIFIYYLPWQNDT